MPRLNDSFDDCGNEAEHATQDAEGADEAAADPGGEGEEKSDGSKNDGHDGEHKTQECAGGETGEGRDDGNDGGDAELGLLCGLNFHEEIVRPGRRDSTQWKDDCALG